MASQKGLQKENAIAKTCVKQAAEVKEQKHCKKKCCTFKKGFFKKGLRNKHAAEKNCGKQAAEVKVEVCSHKRGCETKMLQKKKPAAHGLRT